MNLPALSAAIVHAIRSSMTDSPINQADVVQHMIAEAMEKKPANPYAIFNPPAPTAEGRAVQAIWDMFNKAIARIVRENNLRIEQLTEAQCTQAIIQAFQSGDFQRLVRHGDFAQQVVYLPFAEREALKAEIQSLKQLIVHAYIHDNYRDLGIDQMETPQKKQFLAILKEFGMPESAESLKHWVREDDDE